MSNRKLDRLFEKVEKDVKKKGLAVEKVAPIVVTGGGWTGRFAHKYAPRHVLDVAEKMMGYTHLSDNQKKVLVDMWGLDPEMWKLDWSEAICKIGMRGGKNTIVEVSDVLVLQLIISWEDPYEALSHYCQKEIPYNQSFEFTNNSMVGEEQAKTVYFKRIQKVLRTVRYPETGENLFVKFNGLDIREDSLGDIRSKIIEFKNFNIKNKEGCGNIQMHSLDSGVTTFEGKNIIRSNVDEPSRAATQKGFQNGLQLWDGLSTNVAATYPNGVGKIIAFSYPNTSEYDLIEHLAKEELDARKKAEEDNEKKIESERVPYQTNRKVYVYSTFKFNPSVKRDSVFVQKKYKNNPDDAKARFECIKVRTQHSFFKPNIEKIRECAMPDLHNRVSYSQEIKTKKLTFNTEKHVTMLDVYEIKGDNRYRVAAMDTSMVKDRFVFGLAYSETLEKELNTYIEPSVVGPSDNRVIMDTLLVWEPTKSAPVDYDNVGKVIMRIIDAFPNISLFTSDQYQSESIAAIFEQKGIKTDIFKFSTSEQFEFYSLLRHAVYNGSVGYLKHELLLSELERLQKIGENKVDHPLDFSKDVADVLALLYKPCSSLEFSEISDSGGLDRYKDAAMIDLCDKYVKGMNEVKAKGIIAVDDYLCEYMNVSMTTLMQVKIIKENYFPTK